MNKNQIIHHISERLEFLLNHSDGADRNLNADKITELSALLRDITIDEDTVLTPRGNSFTYDNNLYDRDVRDDGDRPSSPRGRPITTISGSGILSPSTSTGTTIGNTVAREIQL